MKNILLNKKFSFLKNIYKENILLNNFLRFLVNTTKQVRNKKDYNTENDE